MKPIEFKEQNAVLAKDQPEYLPLPIHRVDEPQGRVISCWKLSPSEVELIGRTHRIWLSQMTFNKPPMPLFLAVGKSELFNDATDESVKGECHGHGITHNCTMHFDLWDRIRILFGSKPRYSVRIKTDRDLRVYGHVPSLWVPELFSWPFRKNKTAMISDGQAQEYDCN